MVCNPKATYRKLRYENEIIFLKYSNLKKLLGLRQNINGRTFIIVNRNLPANMRQKILHKLIKNKGLIHIKQA